jgi:nicotinate-nucleotide pyrophosphorylase (carboxylating)
MSDIYDSLQVWKSLLTQGLEDDDWRWDWTTLGTLKKAKRPSALALKAQIVAKAPGVWAAGPLVAAVNSHEEVLRAGSAHLMVRSKLRDGQRFTPGTVVAEWAGSARLLLAFERPFLNLASYVCGMATRTRQLVDAVEGAWPKNSKYNIPRVTSTRKTLPGYRDLAIHAVQAGGGYSHRMSLSGGVLIKENHIAAAGGVGRAIEGARSVAPHGLKIEIEVRDLNELAEALAAEAEVVMLDNFSPAEVRNALRVIERASRRPDVEVSGGLNEKTIGSYAIEGVNILSVGSLTHTVQATDLSLLVNQVRQLKKARA